MSNACEACGWAAALVSMLAFGSFGAPIKSDAAKSVDIDPLVFQSYKTFLCFITSWLVLLWGQEFTFTSWGIVSASFWVPGGVATIYAVKTAGLAIAIGVGSSFIVLVSFTWGIFIFEEQVRSRFGACFAVFLMIAGLFGMSYYSSPEAASVAPREEPTSDVASTRSDGYQGVQVAEVDEEDVASTKSNPLEIGRGSPRPDGRSMDVNVVDICGWKVSKRTSGIAAAMFNGIWGGSIMVPMKWAPPGCSGMGYVISFGIGASIVTLLLWVLRFWSNFSRMRSAVSAYQALPSLHIRTMWLAGGTSGLLWSIGNFGSMISVQHLGEGVGYSVVQAAMLVSGLWGIFYFREIKGTVTISKWFFSASITVCGIILLSYEHHAAPDR